MSHAPNLLHAFEPHRRHNAQSFRRHLPKLVIVGIVGLFLIVLGSATLVGLAVKELASGKESIVAARDAATKLEIDTAKQSLEKAHISFTRAEALLTPFAVLEPLPIVGVRVGAMRDLLSSGNAVIASLSEVLELGGDVLGVLAHSDESFTSVLGELSPTTVFEDLTDDQKRLLFERLAASAPTWGHLATALADALSALDRLPDDPWIVPMKEALKPFETKIRDAEETARLFSVLSRLLPPLAGLNEEQRWLVLFLNNGELRPGGGFIGNYGTARMKDGVLTDVHTQDIYRIDETVKDRFEKTPPPPLQAYLGSQKWFLRDMNWSPDFEVSARAVEQAFLDETALFTEQERATIQPPFDPTVVIGLTPTFAAQILVLTGPIDAGGQTFTSTNIFDTLEYRVEFGFSDYGVSYDQRKDVIAELVNKTVERLEGLSLGDALRFASIIEEGLETKQLLFAFEEPGAQKIVRDNEWGGDITPESVDHLMVVDANLASLKTDQVIDRELAYHIFQDAEGKWRGRADITYHHHGHFDWKTTRYRTYTRLYTPRGSELIKIEGSLLNDARLNPSKLPGPIDQFDEGEHKVFGTFTALEPGTSRTLSFEFFLAPQVVASILNESYELHLIKQIGVPEVALTLDLPFAKTLSAPDRLMKDEIVTVFRP